MRDPLDQWAEGETSAAFQGDSPGHRVQLAAEWRQHGSTGPSTHGAGDGAQPPAVSDPVNVLGPRGRGEQQPRRRMPHPQQQLASWEAVRALPGDGAPFPPKAPAPPPATGGPGGPGGNGPPGEHFASPLQPPHPRRRFKKRRPLRNSAIVLLSVILVGSAGTYAWAEASLQRNVNLDHYGSRPPAGEGTTYLIVGSDSREGLSEADRRELHTGVFGGRRTDSMILMHKGKHGTTMVSLPRDSWVTLPGYTRPSTGKKSGPLKNKLNAAFSQGGPELLVSTIEQNTGVRIDHYAEIGFAGFVNIVNAVGGVPMCIDRDIKDKDSGADLRKGCQKLDGTEALAFVRQRHQEAKGDLGRTKNQQKFLSALADKAAAPDTVLDPSQIYPAVSAGLDTLVVDENMSMQALTKMFKSVQGATNGKGKQVNVPTSGAITTSKGSAVRWNAKEAKKLFTELRKDQPITFSEK